MTGIAIMKSYKAFDINYDQYVAIRENLNRLGLMENEYDDKLVKDINNLQVAIDEIRGSTESIIKALSGARNAKIKTLSNKSKVRLKAKDRLKISKFGRDFIRFLLLIIQMNNFIYLRDVVQRSVILNGCERPYKATETFRR